MTEQEEMYDILIPPGVPRRLIIDIAKRFDVTVVVRKERIAFANMEGDLRELLAFRGKQSVLKEVETYMRTKLTEFVS